MSRKKDELDPNVKTQDIPEPNGEQPQEDAPEHPEPPTQQPPAEPSTEPDLDAIADEFNALYDSTLGKGGLKMGKFILDKFFGGNLDKALSKDPGKNESFAALVKTGKLKVDATTLSAWVRAAHLSQWFENNNHPLDNLTTSHFVALLPLEDEEKRRVLAVKANSSRISVRDLRDLVAKAKSAGTIDWGKRAVKALGNATNLSNDTDLMKVLVSETLLLEKLNDPDLEKIEKKIDEVKKNINKVKEGLKAHEEVLDDVLERVLNILLTVRKAA